MKNHLTLFGMLAIGCAGESGKDSGTTTTEDCAAEDFYTGPVTIEQASVECNGNNTVRFAAETKGWTDGGYVFSQETGNPEPQWSDQHDLASVDFDPCGAFDKLEREIQDGDTLADPTNDWQENVSSVFQCDDHYESPGIVMSYAFAVVDIDGAFADCVAYGDDPDGLVNDAYNRLANPVGFDASDCSRGVLAR